MKVLGIDPGPRPGLVVLQIAASTIVGVEVLDDPSPARLPLASAHLISMERFIVGHGTARKTRAGAAETLAYIAEVSSRSQVIGTRLVSFPAGTVKPWATDTRLREYGAWVPGDHHRDAARHALFAAVRLQLLPRRPPKRGA